MWTVVEYIASKKKGGIGCWGVPDSWVDRDEMKIYYPKNWLTQRRELCSPEPSWEFLKINRILFSNIGI